MADIKAPARKRAPTHPGKIIERELRDMDPPVSNRAAAAAIGVSPPALDNIIKGASAVSPEMALRLGKYFDNGAELWIGMQVDYDLWHARAAMKDQLAKIKPAA